MTLYRGGWPYGHAPNTDFVLNTESPQAVGLTAWWPFGNYQNLERVQGIEMTKSGSPDFAATEQGIALDLAAADSDYLYNDSQNLLTGVPFSISCWVYLKQKPVTFGDEFTFLSFSDPDSSSNFCILRADDAADRFQFNLNDSGGTNSTTASTDFVANRWYQVTGVAASATDRRILVNGGSKGTNTANCTPNFGLMNGITIGMFRFNNQLYDYADAYIRDVRFYNRALSDQEALNLYNPSTRYELYAPEIPIFYSIPVAVGAYYQSAAGALTPVGVISKKTAKAFTGSSTLVGSLIKQSQKVFTGAITASGVLVKQTGKIAIGSITSSGVLVRSTAKSFTGSLTAVGTIVKQTSKSFTGSMTATGVLGTVKA
ncbi:LamG domain-containing protein, partial [bacterium]|nr:LamG domain-containing protein [bacterium]